MSEYRIQNSEKARGAEIGSPTSFLNSEFCILTSAIFVYDSDLKAVSTTSQNTSTSSGDVYTLGVMRSPLNSA
jgi:hypothetical protein